MKNKLTDLNDHLFAQIERLGDEDLDIEQLKKEVDRSKAINAIAGQIIDNARVALEGAKFQAEYTKTANISIPHMLENKAKL